MTTIWYSSDMAQVPVLYVGIQPQGVTQFNEIQINNSTGSTVAAGTTLAPGTVIH
jgi:hypothetical protein